MFDAALGTAEFVDVLALVNNHFGAGDGILFELNRKFGTIERFVAPGLVQETRAKDYLQHLNSINPRMRYSLRHAAGHVAYDGLFISESGMDGSEFYASMQQYHGFRYFLGSRLYDQGEISVFHAIQFTPNHGHPERDKIDVFAKTARNLGKAWKLARSQSPVRDTKPDRLLFDHLPWAVFSVDHDCRCAAENDAAHALLSRPGTLSLTEGRLRGGNSAINTEILTLSHRAISGQSGCMILPVADGGLPMILQSLAVPGRRHAYLFLRDPRQSYDFVERILPAFFNLSPAESRLIKALAGGGSLDAVAEELRLSYNTVRNQLQTIYGKTGARNRFELHSHILGLIDNT